MHSVLLDIVACLIHTTCSMRKCLCVPSFQQMGIGTKDKTILKKRLKELRTAHEKERKLLEKEQRSKSPVTQKKKSKSLFARF